MNQHWRKRVHERCPPGTDPDILYKAVIEAAQHDKLGVRIEKLPIKNWIGSRSIWRYKLDCGTLIFPIISDKSFTPITVLTHEQVKRLKRAIRINKSVQAVEKIEMMEEVVSNFKQCIKRKRKRK